jgi:uncharacterized protein YlzI (FlbEa/FlbD family)
MLHILTLNTLEDQTVTVIADNICAMEQNRDTEGTVISLVNGDRLTVRESMVEIFTELQQQNQR